MILNTYVIYDPCTLLLCKPGHVRPHHVCLRINSGGDIAVPLDSYSFMNLASKGNDHIQTHLPDVQCSHFNTNIL